MRLIQAFLAIALVSGAAAGGCKWDATVVGEEGCVSKTTCTDAMKKVNEAFQTKMTKDKTICKSKTTGSESEGSEPTKATCEKDANCVWVECSGVHDGTHFDAFEGAYDGDLCMQKGDLAAHGEECDHSICDTLDREEDDDDEKETACNALESMTCKNLSNAAGYEAPLAALIASLALLGASF